MYRGVYTALITPFTADGKFDEAALRKNIEFQLERGVAGFVPMGSTGESATVSHSENIQFVKLCVEIVAGRAEVIAGTGSNSTAEAIEMTLAAKEVGATAHLQVVPYYNKPNQDGLYRHFESIADAVDLPLVLYNIPGRSAVNLEVKTTLALAEHARIAGVKEASGNFANIMEILARRPKGFSVLSGDDIATLPMMALGAEGVIAVSSNIVPAEFSELCRLALDGRLVEARALHFKLLNLFNAMGSDTNPMPVKYALSLLGFCQPHIRLPLTLPTEASRTKVEAALRELSLLK